MIREVPTTRYFAVGFFTAAQLEEKHRAMLARAAQSPVIPEILSAVEVVFITIFGVDTGVDTVEMGIRKVRPVVQNPMQSTGVSFEIERFNSTQFPGALSPEEPFVNHLTSPAGIASFATATAVGVFGIDVDPVRARV